MIMCNSYVINVKAREGFTWMQIFYFSDITKIFSKRMETGTYV